MKKNYKSDITDKILKYIDGLEKKYKVTIKLNIERITIDKTNKKK